MRALSNVLAILLRGQDVFPAPQARAIRVFRDSSKRLLDGHGQGGSTVRSGGSSGPIGIVRACTRLPGETICRKAIRYLYR